jgi:hypothetical protein
MQIAAEAQRENRSSLLINVSPLLLCSVLN